MQVPIQKLVAMDCCLATISERQDQGKSATSMAEEEDGGRLDSHCLSFSAQDQVTVSSPPTQNKLLQFPSPAPGAFVPKHSSKAESSCVAVAPMTPLLCSFQRLMGRAIAALETQPCKVKVFRCKRTHAHALQRAPAVAPNVGMFGIVGAEEKPRPLWTLPGNSRALAGVCTCIHLLDRTLGTNVLRHTMH